MNISYKEYIDCISEQLKKPYLTFKCDPRYTSILEHVSVELGVSYLELINQEFEHLNIHVIEKFCQMNDCIGSPTIKPIGTLVCSPTSLRYVYHACLALKHMSWNMSHPVNIVEIGGGYGGLCLAIHFFASYFGIKIKSYSIIDIAEATKLQATYLQHYTKIIGDSQLRFLASGESPYQIQPGSFLISNYCFSEIDEQYRKHYEKEVLPYISHGFMAWNFIDVYKFGNFTIVDMIERPLTHARNRFVYF